MPGGLRFGVKKLVEVVERTLLIGTGSAAIKRLLQLC